MQMQKSTVTPVSRAAGRQVGKEGTCSGAYRAVTAGSARVAGVHAQHVEHVAEVDACRSDLHVSHTGYSAGQPHR